MSLVLSAGKHELDPRRKAAAPPSASVGLPQNTPSIPRSASLAELREYSRNIGKTTFFQIQSRFAENSTPARFSNTAGTAFLGGKPV
jgi:hypothetical protein